jgi:hypothetical protein
VARRPRSTAGNSCARGSHGGLRPHRYLASQPNVAVIRGFRCCRVSFSKPCGVGWISSCQSSLGCSHE